MNFASLFNLAGPDLVIILLIVLLLFGAKGLPNLARHMENEVRRWKGESPEAPEADNRSTVWNRLIIMLAIVFFLLACVIWVCGPKD